VFLKGAEMCVACRRQNWWKDAASERRRRIGKHKPQAAGQIGSCTEIEMSEEEISAELGNRKLNLAFCSSISFSHSL